MFKKFGSRVTKVTAILAAVLLALPSSAQAAGWNFPSELTVQSGTTMVAVNEPNTFDQWNSWQSANFANENTRPETHLCPTGPDLANCDPTKFRLEAKSLLPACKSVEEENCVAGLAFIDPQGIRTTAKFIKQIEAETYAGIPALNLVGGSSVSLWTADGVTHGGNGTTYAISAKLDQLFSGSKYRTEGINISVVPSTIGTGGMIPHHTEQADSTGSVRVGTRHDANCTWAETGACGLAEDFNTDYRVEVSLRITNQITGWFRGRLKTPDASITKFSATANTMVVSGLPVEVPRMAALATKETTSARGVAILERTGGKNPNAPLFSGRSIKDFSSNEGQRIFEVIDEFRLAAKDTAAGTSVLWNFSTVQATGNKCLADTSKVLGFVTTNATGYSGTAPAFEKGSLNYDVAGLHFAPDGSLNEGTYDLMMRSDVARCLYKFGNAPLSASVSVVNEKGAKTTATSVVSEKNGWLKMAAYGFTFSNKTIKVKITKKTVKKVVKKK